MPQNAASDQGLHCLLTGISIRNRIKMKKYTRHPKFGNGLVQLIWMNGSTRQIWVNTIVFEYSEMYRCLWTKFSFDNKDEIQNAFRLHV